MSSRKLKFWTRQIGVLEGRALSTGRLGAVLPDARRRRRNRHDDKSPLGLRAGRRSVWLPVVLVVPVKSRAALRPHCCPVCKVDVRELGG